jgi:hypothetical protein
MPTIAWFYGIMIQMFYNDHEPRISTHGMAGQELSSGFPTVRLSPASYRP